MELRRIYIVANETKEGVLRALAILKAWCQLKEIEATPVDYEAPAYLETEGALVVALGETAPSYVPPRSSRILLSLF